MDRRSTLKKIIAAIAALFLPKAVTAKEKTLSDLRCAITEGRRSLGVLWIEVAQEDVPAVLMAITKDDPDKLLYICQKGDKTQIGWPGPFHFEEPSNASHLRQ